MVAVAIQLSAGNEGQLIAYANVCCAPAYSYFTAKFDNDHSRHLLAFRATRYFSPSTVNELNPAAADI